MDRITFGELSSLECEYNISLPDEIKEFLCSGNLDLNKRTVHLESGSWKSEIRVHGLYSTLNGLKSSLDWLSESWWPEGYVAFGYDEGGESFCVCIKPDKLGQIFYFMSDCIGDDSEDSMLFVSNSLSEFISSLE